MRAEVTILEKPVGGAKSVSGLQIDEEMIIGSAGDRQGQSPIPRPLQSPQAGSNRSSGVRPPPSDNPLDYEIPKVVDTLREGRLSSCNAAAIVTALFATIEATMISVLKTSTAHSHGSASAMRLLLILSYAGLILNASTTFTALLLIDRLGNLTFRSMKAPPTVTISSLQTGRRLLGRFGASGITWDIMEFHFSSAVTYGFMRADPWQSYHHAV
ncbi:hypothetical protein FRB96_005124 [Tulasnella sp. 330]|nr:hypothetical protein FRB96_005124 [Tulasnella sp. 330]